MDQSSHNHDRDFTGDRQLANGGAIYQPLVAEWHRTPMRSALAAIPTSFAEYLRTLWQRWAGPETALYGSILGADALAYLFLMLMARTLTVAEYGELVTLTASAYILSVAVRAIQVRSAQAVSAIQGSGSSASERGYLILRQSLRHVLVGAVIIFGIFWLLSSPIATFLNLRSRLPVIMLGVYLATGLLLPVPRGLLLGTGQMHYASWIYLVEPVARLALGWVLASTALGTSGALLGYAAGRLAATLVATLPFLPARRLSRSPASQPAARAWSFDRQFFFALLVDAALMLLASLDPIAIKHFFSESIAGAYGVAFLLGRIILLSTMAANWVIFSRTVKLRIHDPQAAPVLRRGLSLGGAIAGTVTLAYLVAPNLAAAALGGSDYRAASDFVGLVGLEMTLFTLVAIQAYYHIAVRNTIVLWPLGSAMALEAFLLATFHATPYHILFDTLATLSSLLIWISLLTVRALAPKEIAAGRPRVGVVVHSHYPSDPRVRREAEALLDEGWEVDVICLPDGPQSRYERVNHARVFRLPVARHRSGSQLTYLLEYAAFFIAAATQLTWLHLRRPYRIVHVHNMPDFLVFVAVIPKLLGARVVLDIHDLVPEFYRLRYGLSPDHPGARFIHWIQAKSANFAHHVITAGEPFRRRLSQATVTAEKATSVMNSPDPNLFFPGLRHKLRPLCGERFVLAYHGSLSEHYDLESVFQAMVLIRDQIRGIEFHIYGRGRTQRALQDIVHELHLEEVVSFFGFVPLDQLPNRIAGVDLGVAPMRRSDHASLAYPTKIFEYIALGIPALMSWAPHLAELFVDIPGIFYQPGCPNELAELIWQIHRDPLHARAIVTRQQAACAAIAWPKERQRFVALMNQLAELHPATKYTGRPELAN